MGLSLSPMLSGAFKPNAPAAMPSVPAAATPQKQGFFAKYGGDISQGLQAAYPLLIAMSQGMQQGNPSAYMGQGLAGMMGLAQQKTADREKEAKRAADAKAKADALEWTKAALGSSAAAQAGYSTPNPSGLPSSVVAAVDRADPPANQADFVKQMMPHALRVSQETGLDPRLVIAQAAQETGWGKHVPNNNYFGVKSHGKPGVTMSTKEVIGGREHVVPASFRTYGGMGESADDYAAFLKKNPRYSGMLNAQGLDAQLAELGRSGYATDPNYASSVGRIAQGIQMPSGMLDMDRAAQILASEHVPAAVKQMVMQQFQPPTQEGWRNLTPQEAAGMGLPEGAYQVGLSGANRGKVVKAGGGGVNVNVNTPQFGKVEPGWMMAEENGGWVQKPVPGGPADREAQANQAEIEKTAAAQAEQAQVQGDAVLSTISEIRDIAGRDGFFDLPEFGIWGDRLARAGINQEAKDIQNKTAALHSAIAFDRLQQMREASPTGGALGAVSERELGLLSAALGDLQQSSSEAEYMRTLQAVEDRYTAIMRKFSADPVVSTQFGLQGWTDDPLGIR